MKTVNSKKNAKLSFVTALTAALALSFAVNAGAANETFEITAVTHDGAQTTFVTTAETVGAALAAEGLISGEVSDYGLYVRFVNGREADYAADESYWTFGINGEYAETGVDATNLAAGDTYTFVRSDEDFPELSVTAAAYEAVLPANTDEKPAADTGIADASATIALLFIAGTALVFVKRKTSK